MRHEKKCAYGFSCVCDECISGPCECIRVYATKRDTHVRYACIFVCIPRHDSHVIIDAFTRYETLARVRACVSRCDVRAGMRVCVNVCIMNCDVRVGVHNLIFAENS